MSSSFDLPTIPIRYLQELASRCPAGARARALARAGLPRAALRADRLRASVTQLERFYASLRDDTQDELFGHLARPVPRGAYALLVRLLTGCSDLASALDAGEHFYRLFDPHPYWRRETRGDTTLIIFSPRDRMQADSLFFVHSMLLAPWRTAAWLAGRPLPLSALWLPSRFRPFASEARFLFGVRPRFGAQHAAIGFKADLLRWKVTRRPDEAREHARTSLREMLSAPGATHFLLELRALLSEAEPFAQLDAGAAARALGLSRATMARRLVDEGKSFRQVKDELRRDRAIGLLTGTQAPLAEIALALGFSEPSAFHRAFRKWTGLAPGQARRAQARAVSR